MKKHIVILFILTSLNILAQNGVTSNYIIKYQLDYIYNPEKNEIKSEVMLLLINNKYSTFQGAFQRNNDSIVKYYTNSSLTENAKYANMMAFTQLTKLKYKIYKEKNNITYKENPVFTKLYSYKEKLHFNWKISEETKQIGNYNCQKATVNFGGRNFTAWFTKEIPINDGPYKFKGLPGLIINLHDDKNHYAFTLLSITKGKMNMDFTTKDAITISKKDFYADIEDYRKNIVPRMIQKGFRFRTEEQKQKFRERGKKFRINELELNTN